MCGACIERLPKRECPVCKAAFQRYQLPDNHFVQNAVCQLRVHCLQHDSGCDWTGQLGMNGRNLTAHDANCPLKRVSCDLCEHSMLRCDFDAHRQSCPKSLVRCCSCQASINLENVEQHFTQLPPSPLPVAAAASSAASLALKAPLLPLCSNTELCPNRCEDTAHPGHLFSCRERAC